MKKTCDICKKDLKEVFHVICVKCEAKVCVECAIHIDGYGYLCSNCN